jgi:Protein of unknown function (DUF402)
MWSRGEVVVRREVLNDGRAWLEVPVIVVRDDEELLATFIAEGAPFRFPDGPWPAPGGRHPWHGKERWHGHGVLMLQRPGEAHAVWLFWRGRERTFAGWYVNIQEPFRRTSDGYDTQDLELDIWIPLDRLWEWKDEELLVQRIREGRFTDEQVAGIRAEGERIARELDAGRRWWDEKWASWVPDPSWPTPRFT